MSGCDQRINIWHTFACLESRGRAQHCRVHARMSRHSWRSYRSNKSQNFCSSSSLADSECRRLPCSLANKPCMEVAVSAANFRDEITFEAESKLMLSQQPTWETPGAPRSGIQLEQGWFWSAPALASPLHEHPSKHAHGSAAIAAASLQISQLSSNMALDCRYRVYFG